MEVEELRQALAKTQAELATATELGQHLMQQNHDITQQSILAAKEMMDQSEQEMSELTAAMQELHDQYKDLKERFKKTEAECVQFRSKVTELNVQNLTLRNELASTVEDSRRAQIVLRQQLQSTMQRQLDGGQGVENSGLVAELRVALEQISQLQAAVQSEQEHSKALENELRIANDKITSQALALQARDDAAVSPSSRKHSQSVALDPPAARAAAAAIEASVGVPARPRSVQQSPKPPVTAVQLKTKPARRAGPSRDTDAPPGSAAAGDFADWDLSDRSDVDHEAADSYRPEDAVDSQSDVQRLAAEWAAGIHMSVGAVRSNAEVDESALRCKVGWLLKQSDHLKQWRWRWFVLRNGVLTYYRNPSKNTQSYTISLCGLSTQHYDGRPDEKPQDTFSLHPSTVQVESSPARHFCFRLIVPFHRTTRRSIGCSYLLSASSQQEADEWMALLTAHSHVAKRPTIRSRSATAVS